jgi:sigma-B regulation protein RsbU (phosphoserine phosphatase)
MPRPAPGAARPEPPPSGGRGEDGRGGPGRGGPGRGGGDRRANALILEIALELNAVSGVFSGLRNNLVSGVIVALVLIAAMVVIGFRTPSYLRGQYLDKEMLLARRVQGDLLPKAKSVSPHVEFAASAIAADQVGGDFFDIFETDTGRVSIVLGDASGKGIPAALLASVIQGAIRSSGGAHPDTACDRINRMVCEKTASERFVTVFWGVFDPLTATLQYVNAGHAAPLLQRAHPELSSAMERLDQGGPVLGMLPNARYSAGIVQIHAGDILTIYSDGINEAADLKDEEFGDDRVRKIVADFGECPAQEICERIMSQVGAFAAPGPLSDDRTLMVVRFLKSRAAMTA